MRTRSLAPLLLLIATLTACGDMGGEDAPVTAPPAAETTAADDAGAVLFDDGFESGETESWEDGEAADEVDAAGGDAGGEGTGDDG